MSATNKNFDITPKKYTSDVIIRLITQGMLRLRGLIFLPLIAKTLGTSQYGIWTQITVTLSLLVPVLTLRLETASVRYLSSKNEDTVSRDFFSMLVLIWIVSVVIATIIFLYKRQVAVFLFDNQEQVLYVELLFLLLLVRITFSFLRNYYRIFNQISKYSIIELLVTFGAVGAAIFFIFSGKGLVGVLISFILTEAIASTLMLFDIIRLRGFPHRLGFTNLVFYLRYTLPLIPNTLLLWVINSSDRYVIIHILDLTQVGIYSASYSLGKMAVFFLTPISFVLFPAISKLWEKKRYDEVRKYIRNSLKYYILLGIPSIFTIYYLSPFILKTLATSEFVTDRLLVLFIVLGFFCIGIYRIYIYIIHLREKTKYLPFLFFTVASLNLGLNFLLIPKVGIIGAAFSTFLSYLIQAIIVIIFSMKLFQVKLDLKFIIKTVGASVGMFFILRLFHPQNIGAIIGIVLIGMVIYFILMVIMKGIGRKEWELLKSTVGI